MEFSSVDHRTDSNFSYPLSNNEVRLILKTKKNDNFKSVSLLYKEKFKFRNEKVPFDEIVLKDKDSDDFSDYYYVTLKLNDVRLGYIFKFVDFDDKVYYFLETGFIKEENFVLNNTQYSFFQVSYINPNDVSRTNEKFKDRVLYQIFVDRFCKVDPTCDSINIEWGDNNKIDSRTHAGGNLKGIISKIDYLKDLGINCIYLTPIFESISNHKYDTFDYYKIAKDFGNEDDLRELVKKCHENDIYLVLDGVFNHVGFYHPFFQDVLGRDKESKYYDYFMIHDDGHRVCTSRKNYESFSYGFGMPKLNTNNEKVIKYIIDIMVHYKKEFDIDGFRLDVADEVSHYFWMRCRFELEKVDPSIFLICENWHDSHIYLDNNREFDSVMNYGFTDSLLNLLVYENYSPKEFKESIVKLFYRVKEQTNKNLLNLLDSHDTSRFITLCNNDEDKAIFAFAFMFLYVGIPFIYYGDETGMTGEDDPICRKMYIWDNPSVLNMKINHYMKELIKIRQDNKLYDLSFKIEEDNGLIKVTRGNDIEALFNYSKDDKEIDIKGKEVVLSNLFENNILKNKGFIILK